VTNKAINHFFYVLMFEHKTDADLKQNCILASSTSAK